MLLMEMVQIYLFDLHCDTVSACLNKNKSLIQNDLHIDIVREKHLDRWVQVFALWLDDCFRGQTAYQHFLSQYNLLYNTIEHNPDLISLYDPELPEKAAVCNAIVAVEGGHVLGGSLERIEELSKMGVSYLTLVWNAENELGSGTGRHGNSQGLTRLGKDAVRELERCGIVVDVSHLNEAGFRDVSRLAAKPFIASHSNSWSICSHPRNLRDYQLQAIIEADGLCGINLYPLFINGSAEYEYDDIVRHIDHILNLGGERILAIGTDFDGAEMCNRINGIQTIHKFYEYMLKWYDRSFLDKMFYKNASDFYMTNVHTGFVSGK